MTDKDAICVLACIAIDLTGCLAGLSSNEPMADVLKQRINAINAAQVAIQERIDREMGCDYCNSPHPARDCVLPDCTEQILCSEGFLKNAYIMERKINYCPMCGRPLKPAMPGEEQHG